MHTVFLNGTIVARERLIEDSILICRHDKIVRIAPRSTTLPHDACVIDVAGGFIAPGFVDLHVHGGAGRDFMDGSVEDIHVACHAHLQHGTTTIFPTTTTGSSQQIMAMLEACQQAQQTQTHATLAGVHLYGPYFAPDKVGCHSLSGRRSPTAAEYENYFASGIVRIATCAAELPGATDFYRAAAEAGCFITCGHSNSSWTEMQQAFDAGVRHVDHFWCAMSSVPSLRQRLGVPMQASMAEFVLLNREMSTEVIADGYHLSPQLLEFAYRMLGPERLCLVTDCNRALDLPPGDYRFGSGVDGTWFHSDGRVGWTMDRQSLASSIVGMDHMVRTMSQSTTATLPEVIRMASLTPATRVGMGKVIGSLQRGKLANVLVLDRELNVQRVFVRGKEVQSLQS